MPKTIKPSPFPTDHSHLFKELASFSHTLVSQILDARHELKAQAKDKAETLAQSLDLVRGDDFEAALAMLKKSRETQEQIIERLARIESFLGLSSVKKTVKTKKKNLPSVKKRKSTGTKK